jgi:hypothetical protein
VPHKCLSLSLSRTHVYPQRGNSISANTRIYSAKRTRSTYNYIHSSSSSSSDSGATTSITTTTRTRGTRRHRIAAAIQSVQTANHRCTAGSVEPSRTHRVRQN